MPDQIPPNFPLAFTILSYVVVALLLLIFIVLLRINWKISSALQQVKGQPSRSERSIPPEDLPEQTPSPSIEVGPGTPFEEFLNEDPAHRALPKKDQFKAYRTWRAAKGLNWSNK